MSIWTYIRGSVELSTSPMKYRLDKDGKYKINNNPRYECRFVEYVPYPDEQITYNREEECWISSYAYNDKEKKAFLENNKSLKMPEIEYKINLTAYPIIKRIVQKHIKDLPAGESNQFPYFLNDDGSFGGSSSWCGSRQLAELFQKHVLKSYIDSGNLWEGATWGDVTKYYPSKISWVEEGYSSILTLHDSVRHCEAHEMYTAIIKFLNHLVQEDISIGRGVIEFDDYITKYLLDINDEKINVTVSYNTEYDDRKPYTEKWQLFSTRYDDRPSKEYEYRKVDEFLKDRDTYKYIENIKNDNKSEEN